MKRGIALLSLLVVMSLTFTGCALLLIGAGAAGGVAISKDSATLTADDSYTDTYNATKKVLNDMGAVTLDDDKGGRLEADVEKSGVTAKVERLTTKATSVTVSARKNLLPNVDLAVKIVNNINDELK